MSSSPLIRRFTDMLGLLAKGRFALKCDEHLAEALEHLSSLPGGQGTATINLTVTLAFQEGMLNVTPRVTSKLPEGKAFGATPFWEHDGALSVQHPSQMDMFVRDASARGSADREDGDSRASG